MADLNSFAELIRKGKEQQQRNIAEELEQKKKDAIPFLSELFSVVTTSKNTTKTVENSVGSVSTPVVSVTSNTKTNDSKTVVEDRQFTKILTKLQTEIASLQRQIGSLNSSYSGYTSGSGEVRVLRMDDVVRETPNDTDIVAWDSSLNKFDFVDPTSILTVTKNVISKETVIPTDTSYTVHSHWLSKTKSLSYYSWKCKNYLTMSQLVFDKLTVPPSTPSIGSVSVYMKSDGVMYAKDDDGGEYPIGPIATDGWAGISSLSSIDYIDYDTTTAIVNAAGRMTWNDTDGTLNLGMKGGNVTLQIGQEQLIRATNNTGTTFTSPQVVSLSGSQGQRLTVALAQANNELTSRNTFAVITETILPNTEGFATVSGLVRDINTTAFAEGDTLYLSSTVAGGLTNVKPNVPLHAVHVGWCIRSHVSLGSIFVNVDNGYELNELHDVLISGITNNDFLIWDSVAAVWKNTQIGAKASVLPTATKTADYTVTNNDYTIRVNAASNVTITLPTATTNTGKTFVVKRIDNTAFKVLVNTTSSQLIDGSLTTELTIQYETLTYQSNGTGYDIL